MSDALDRLSDQLREKRGRPKYDRPDYAVAVLLSGPDWDTLEKALLHVRALAELVARERPRREPDSPTNADIKGDGWGVP